MNCYVKDYWLDKVRGKGQVLVGSYSGPDLWIDVEVKIDRPSEGWSMRCKWSKLYSILKDRKKHRIQYSASKCSPYYVCASRHISKLLKEEQ